MSRGSIVLLIFALAAIVIVGATYFLQARPPLDITVAVSPLAADWVTDAAVNFNSRDPVVNANRRIVIKVISIEDIDVWNGNSNWAEGTLETANRPTIWIPATAASVDYIQGDRRLPFRELSPSLAQTPMMWGGFTERVDALTGIEPITLDWEDVAISAGIGSWGEIGGNASWQFLDLAFANPEQTTAGLAVLMTGAASYHHTSTLTNTDLRDPDFRDWILPVVQSVPNMGSLGADPAQAIAQRGLSIADMALLPESLWIRNLNGLGSPDEFILTYPEYEFVFDFPMMIWDSENVSVDEIGAADQFMNWLLDDARQQGAADYGLRPASGEPAETSRPFLNAEAYGVVRVPTYGTVITAPAKSDIQSLLTWYGQNR